MAGRRIECARGKVVGGSSSINAMAYVRGNRADYDRWAASGLAGLVLRGCASLFPPAGILGRRRQCLSRRRRAARHPQVAIRGSAGDAYLEAAAAAGHPYNEDYNAARQDGFARMQMTIRNGRRASAATAYLRPVHGARESRGHRQRARDPDRARGRARGRRRISRRQHAACRCGPSARCCSPAARINSPQLLMLSGIGDPDELAAHGIPVKVPLRGVGKNLQDHVAALITYARREGGPLHRNMRLDRLAAELVRGYVFGTGFTTDLPGGITAFPQDRRSRESARHPAAVHRRAADGRALSAAVQPADLPTAFPAASCCCVRRAAAAWRSRRPIRWRTRASTRNCWRPSATGKRCARPSRCSATSRGEPSLQPFIASELAPAPTSRRMSSWRASRARPP